MPRSYINSVVFVGREFDVSLFDEKELTPLLGPLDKNSIRAGPVGNFAYSNGHYSFQITPDRIDVRHSGTAILADALLMAVEIVVNQLQPIRGLVSGVGINCDAVFYAREIGKSGRDFCQALMDNELFQSLYAGCQGATPSSVSTVFLSSSREMQNTVRIEPDQSSGQQDLKVAFNGHQTVTVQDDLKVKLEAISEVKDHVTRLHQQIVSLRK